MTRYEQWRANPSSVQPQAPTSSTPSSLCTYAPLPYGQSSTEDDRARRERLHALLREDPRQREDVYPADGAREEHARLRRRREEEVRRWVAGQLGRRLEQLEDGTLRVVMPVSSPVQYPFSASAWDPYGPITAYLPLESPTRPRQDKPNKPPIQPVTTTFESLLSPQLDTVPFPSLMSHHQISQGYHPPLGSMFHRQSHTSHSAPRGSDPVAHNLKTVSFPRDCMNLFTSIASINTAKNRETCGLLLGKDKGERYVVTILLIPKQHTTSDTCAIEEEELVTQFTEERSLITLGWIHTHPTQSCVCFIEIFGGAMT